MAGCAHPPGAGGAAGRPGHVAALEARPPSAVPYPAAIEPQAKK